MKHYYFLQRTIFLMIILGAILLFSCLYKKNTFDKEGEAAVKTVSTLEEWTIDESLSNGVPLKEDKGVYEDTPDTNLYDVYISVFPTENEEGEMLDFSSFAKHTSRDHTYNPILNCNIQILNEDEKMDPLVSLDTKNATIRVRGNSSRGDLYKSYKVKLAEDTATFKGQSVLNINKHSEDVSKISTKLCTDLITKMEDVAGYRTYFMRVWIRDASLPQEEQQFQYYGLYTEIEQPNKTYLESHGLSSNANLYKARDFSFQMSEVLRDVNDPLYNEEEFETVLSIREGKDHAALLEMLQAVNDTTADFEEVFHTYFNEDNYLTWLAFNLLLGNNDIINHNFILYNKENSKTWYFIPWDFDGTLQYGEHESSLMKLPDSLRGGQKLNQNILHKRYFRLDGSMEKIQAKMEELLEDVITKERVSGTLDSYKRVLNKCMMLEPDISLLEMQPNELPAYIDGLYDDCILRNYEEFKTAIQYPAPMYVSIPVQKKDGTIHFAWESSFSYQGYPITYNLQVAKDYYMQEVVIQETDLLGTEYDSDTPLPKGTYYLKVTAVDSLGHEQLSLERFETMITEVKGLNVNGVLEFKVE